MAMRIAPLKSFPYVFMLAQVKAVQFGLSPVSVAIQAAFYHLVIVNGKMAYPEVMLPSLQMIPRSYMSRIYGIGCKSLDLKRSSLPNQHSHSPVSSSAGGFMRSRQVRMASPGMSKDASNPTAGT